MAQHIYWAKLTGTEHLSLCLGDAGNRISALSESHLGLHQFFGLPCGNRTSLERGLRDRPSSKQSLRVIDQSRAIHQVGALAQYRVQQLHIVGTTDKDDIVVSSSFF